MGRHWARDYCPLDSKSEQSLQSVKSWFRNCENSHPGCVVKKNPLPKRLLNVKPWEYSNDIKLVDTEHLDIRSRYVALSRCWGKKQIITTTRATEIDRHKEILFDTLSKTFQDAVLMTRRLDVQYLWINSLYIIQGDAEDWQEQ
jgi:hypothetical protein